MRKGIILYNSGPNIGCANARPCALGSASPVLHWWKVLIKKMDHAHLCSQKWKNWTISQKKAIPRCAQCRQVPGYIGLLLKITLCKISLESAILEHMKIVMRKTCVMCTMIRCAHFQSGPNTKILSSNFVWIYTFTSVDREWVGDKVHKWMQGHWKEFQTTVDTFRFSMPTHKSKKGISGTIHELSLNFLIQFVKN